VIAAIFGELLAQVFGDLLVLSAAERGLKRSAKVARAEGRVVGAIRVREGEHDGLSREWRTAEMAIARGELDLGDVTVSVMTPDIRPAPGVTTFPVSPIPTDVLIELASGGGILQLSVMEVDADRVLAALRGEETTAPE